MRAPPSWKDLCPLRREVEIETAILDTLKALYNYGVGLQLKLSLFLYKVEDVLCSVLDLEPQNGHGPVCT